MSSAPLGAPPPPIRLSAAENSSQESVAEKLPSASYNTVWTKKQSGQWGTADTVEPGTETAVASPAKRTSGPPRPMLTKGPPSKVSLTKLGSGANLSTKSLLNNGFVLQKASPRRAPAPAAAPAPAPAAPPQEADPTPRRRSLVSFRSSDKGSERKTDKSERKSLGGLSFSSRRSQSGRSEAAPEDSSAYADFTVELVKKSATMRQCVTLRLREDGVQLLQLSSGKLLSRFDVKAVGGWKVAGEDEFVIWFYDEGKEEMQALTLRSWQPEDIRYACQRLLTPNF